MTSDRHKSEDMTLQLFAELFAPEPPDWAKDPFNNDDAYRCGYCGAWMEVVRPGKVQCITPDCVQIS